MLSFPFWLVMHTLEIQNGKQPIGDLGTSCNQIISSSDCFKLAISWTCEICFKRSKIISENDLRNLLLQIWHSEIKIKLSNCRRVTVWYLDLSVNISLPDRSLRLAFLIHSRCLTAHDSRYWPLAQYLQLFLITEGQWPEFYLLQLK